MSLKNLVLYFQAKFVGVSVTQLFFKAGFEYILKKTLEGETAGIKVNEIPINNIKYSNGTVILAKNLKDLQRLMNKIVLYEQEYRIKFIVVSNI